MNGAVVSVVVGSEAEIKAIGHGHVTVSASGTLGQRRATDSEMDRVIKAFSLEAWREVSVAEAEGSDLRVRHLYQL